jgi:hypothetical protein
MAPIMNHSEQWSGLIIILLRNTSVGVNGVIVGDIWMNKFYVIAKSQLQGHHWVDNRRSTDDLFNHEYPNRTDAIVVTRPEHLRGCNVEHGILLSGWKEIPDIEEILFLAQIHSQGKIPALKKAYDEIRPSVRPTPKKPSISGMTYTQSLIDAAEIFAKEIDNEVLKSLMKTST